MVDEYELIVDSLRYLHLHIITIIKTTSVGEASSGGNGLTGCRPVTVGVVKVGVVDTRYGVRQPGADAER